MKTDVRTLPSNGERSWPRDCDRFDKRDRSSDLYSIVFQGHVGVASTGDDMEVERAKGIGGDGYLITEKKSNRFNFSITSLSQPTNIEIGWNCRYFNFLFLCMAKSRVVFGFS